MTEYAPWEERERRPDDEFYFDSPLRRTHDQRGPSFAGTFSESYFYDRVGPGPACYACGGAPSSAYSYGSAHGPYASPRSLEPHDIDMILVRLLEGYRILDELFNPRSVRTRLQPEVRDPRPETHQTQSDREQS